jgi:hypothetical protein
MKVKLTILALAMVQFTGISSGTALDKVTVNRIADAIFRSENSINHPYGIMIPTKDPRRVCINTITHAWVNFEGDEARTGRNDLSLNHPLGDKVSLPFISFLGHRYCPPSVDPIGYQHWTNNAFCIYKQLTKE